MTRRAPLLLFNLALVVLLSQLPSASFSAFDENEASWTRGRWDTAPFKLPLPFTALRGGGEQQEEGAKQRDTEAQSPSSSASASASVSSSLLSSSPSPSSSSPSFPASSLLGPLSAASLALSAAAREKALARDDWELDERDVSRASEALACDACRAAVARGWELGAGWVALQGRTETKATTPNAAAAAAASATAAAASASAASAPPAPPQRTETVFLLPAQLRQRLRLGVRAWCEREGEQGQATASGRALISPGSALEGAKLVREEEGGRWRRVERPSQAEEAAAAAAAATTKTTLAAATSSSSAAATSPRERLAARLACSGLLFSPPSPSAQQQQQQQSAAGATKKEAAAPDPPVVAALADGLSLFAAALSRAANSNAAGANALNPNDNDEPPPPPPPRLPPTLYPGRRPDLSGRVCADYHPECAGWASFGECEANPGYMVGDDDKFFADEDGNNSSFSSGGKERDGSAAASSSTTVGQKRRRPGFCRFSCGVCSPMPHGFPSSSSAGAATSLLAAVARLPPKSQEAAALEAEALAIKEGVLLRACYASKPCGGRGGGEKRFRRWFEEEDEKEEGDNKSNATLVPSPSPPSSPSAASPLHNRCFVSATGWWVYEVCVGGGIRQFHPPTSPRDAPAANLLGTFSSSSESSSLAAKETKWLTAAELYRGGPLKEEAVDGDSKVFAFVEQQYAEGDPCGESEAEEKAATARRRSATLRLVCPSLAAAKDVDAVPRLLVAEPSTCVYVLTLFHPEACALVDKDGGGEEGGGGGGRAVTKGEEGETATTDAAAAMESAAAAAVPLEPPAAPSPSLPAVPAVVHDEL